MTLRDGRMARGIAAAGVLALLPHVATFAIGPPFQSATAHALASLRAASVVRGSRRDGWCRAWTMQDLRDGMDADRNQQIAALKKSFYSSSDGGDGASAPEGTAVASRRAPDAEWMPLLGVYEDMPLCRWDMVMLPGFNQVLNVFQPMYTHMFEAIVAKKERPWYYVHLQTPGGANSLTNPDFDLRVGTQAPLIGVLMRIGSCTRMEDSRLHLIVQGLARVRVIEQTQRSPFARATVQLLPDAEITASYYSLATTELMGIPAEMQADPSAFDQQAGGSERAQPAAGGGAQSQCERWVHTVAHAAAVASEALWLEYEVACETPRRGGKVPQLCSFSAQRGLAREIADRAPLRELAARTQAIRLAGAYDGLCARNVSVRGAPVLSPTDLGLLGVLGGVCIYSVHTYTHSQTHTHTHTHTHTNTRTHTHARTHARAHTHVLRAECERAWCSCALPYGFSVCLTWDVCVYMLCAYMH